VDSKFSLLRGRLLVMVVGMAPCAVPWYFIGPTVNARYQIELAGKLYHLLKFCISWADAKLADGGYYNAKDVAATVQKMEQKTTLSSGITANLIYTNPRAMEWQIPLPQQLCSAGAPIEGLAVGAWVPSI